MTSAKELDKFYTNENIVYTCVRILKEKLSIHNEDTIIEPSAGSGVWIPHIKKLTCNYKFFDIVPEHPEICTYDYLTYKHNCKKNINTIYVVGNPPFGRQCSLCLKFINHSACFADYIAFVLPKSFKKESVQKKVHTKLHLIYSEDLPENSFNIDKELYDVPCVFQIWKKEDFERKPIIKVKPIGYKFVKNNENPDIWFRRVGVYAGSIDNVKGKVCNTKSVQSHYFIKFENFSQQLFDKLKCVDFDDDSSKTVGPKSISKQEICRKYNVFFT